MHSRSYVRTTQHGEGLFDTLLGVAKKSGSFLTKASDIWNSDLATGAKNLFLDENNQQYAGEKHAILKVPNKKKFVVGNWTGQLGPGH